MLTDPQGQQILRAALDDLKSAVKVFPSTLEVVAAVQAMGCVTPEGTLIRTGTDLRRVSMQRSVSAKALEGGCPGLLSCLKGVRSGMSKTVSMPVRAKCSSDCALQPLTFYLCFISWDCLCDGAR